MQENKIKTQYQVWLYYSRAHLPFFFASHGWLVIRNGETISRFDILFRKHACPTSWGHLHKNYLAPHEGIEIIPYWMKFFWKGHLVGSIEGDEHSLAHHMVEYIEKSPMQYPYCSRYFLLGPNSNTFPQWILNAFPECSLKLAWNSFGRNYR